MSTRILLVDDECNILSALKRAMLDEQFEILTATSAEMALDIMERQSFKVVVSDEGMAGMLGSAFLARIRELYPDTVRIMLTGQATMEAAMRAVNEGGIYRFFTKPWNDVEIRFAIRSAIEKYDLEVENRRLMSMVRRQELELRTLEKQYPGITSMKKDRQGSFVLPDISEEEIERLVAECEKKLC